MYDSIRIRHDNNVLGAKKEGRLQANGAFAHPGLLQIYNETSKGLVMICYLQLTAGVSILPPLVFPWKPNSTVWPTAILPFQFKLLAE